MDRLTNNSTFTMLQQKMAGCSRYKKNKNSNVDFTNLKKKNVKSTFLSFFLSFHENFEKNQHNILIQGGTVEILRKSFPIQTFGHYFSHRTRTHPGYGSV